jgi:dTMP kinase
MDLGLSSDPIESFRLFQERVLDEYDRLATEYDFRVVDGTRSIDAQQRQVRDYVRRLYDGVAAA